MLLFRAKRRKIDLSAHNDLLFWVTMTILDLAALGIIFSVLLVGYLCSTQFWCNHATAGRNFYNFYLKGKDWNLGHSNVNEKAISLQCEFKISSQTWSLFNPESSVNFRSSPKANLVSSGVFFLETNVSWQDFLPFLISGEAVLGLV